MDSQFIAALIKANARLVIPSLGAFLHKENGDIVFSPFLNKDDGALQSAVCKQFNLSAVQAQQEIDRFVSEIKGSLTSIGKYYIDNVGILSVNDNGGIVLIAESPVYVAPKVEAQHIPSIDPRLSSTGSTSPSASPVASQPIAQAPIQAQAPLEQPMQMTIPTITPQPIGQPLSQPTQPVAQTFAQPTQPVAQPITQPRPQPIARPAQAPQPSPVTAPVGQPEGMRRPAMQSAPNATSAQRPQPSVARPGGQPNWVPPTQNQQQTQNPIRQNPIGNPIVNQTPAGVNGQRNPQMGNNGNPSVNPLTQNRPNPNVQPRPQGSMSAQQGKPRPQGKPQQKPQGRPQGKGGQQNKVDMWLLVAIVAAILVVILIIYGLIYTDPAKLI